MILPHITDQNYIPERPSSSVQSSLPDNPAAATILATDAASSSTKRPVKATLLKTIGSKISSFFSKTTQPTSALVPTISNLSTTSPAEFPEQVSSNDPYSYLQPRDQRVQTISILIDDQPVDVLVPPNFKIDCCERLKDWFSINGASVTDLLKGISEEEAERHLLTHIYLQLPSDLDKEAKINLLQNIAKTMTQSTALKMNNLMSAKLSEEHKINSSKLPSNAKTSIELLIHQKEIQVSASCKCVYTEKLGEDGLSGWVKLDQPIRAESSIIFSFTKNGRLSTFPDVTTKTLPSKVNLFKQILKKTPFALGEHLNSETIQQFEDPRSTQGPFVNHYYGTTDQNVYLQQLQKDLATHGIYRKHLTNVISALETRHQAKFREIVEPHYFKHFQELPQGEIVFGEAGTKNSVWTKIISQDPNQPIILKCEAQMIIRDVRGAPLPENLIQTATVKTLYIINNLGEVTEIHDLTIQTAGDSIETRKLIPIE